MTYVYVTGAVAFVGLIYVLGWNIGKLHSRNSLIKPYRTDYTAFTNRMIKKYPVVMGALDDTHYIDTTLNCEFMRRGNGLWMAFRPYSDSAIAGFGDTQEQAFADLCEMELK